MTNRYPLHHEDARPLYLVIPQDEYDILVKAERAIMQGYAIEATKSPPDKATMDMIIDLNKLPKTNHIDFDFLALRGR